MTPFLSAMGITYQLFSIPLKGGNHWNKHGPFKPAVGFFPRFITYKLASAFTERYRQTVHTSFFVPLRWVTCPYLVQVGKETVINAPRFFAGVVAWIQVSLEVHVKGGISISTGTSHLIPSTIPIQIERFQGIKKAPYKRELRVVLPLFLLRERAF